MTKSASIQKPTKQPIETVGCIFWLAIFLLTLGPSIYLCWRVTYEDTTLWAPAIFGLSGAALLAGVISLIVNSILQHRVEKRRKSERKLERKSESKSERKTEHKVVGKQTKKKKKRRV